MNHEEFGTSEDYLGAFEGLVAEGIPENHLALLRAHHSVPHHRATWAQLAEAIGYANGKAVNLQYGTLATRVANRMGIEEVPNGFMLDVLAGWADERDPRSGHTSFILRNPVIEALTRLGVLPDSATDLSEQHIVGEDLPSAPSHWWFGVNNSRARATEASPGHVHYRDIGPFIRGEEPSFAWPYGGAPGSEKMYPRMRAGDRVVIWMGDGVEKAWGIVGFALIDSVRVADRRVLLVRDGAPTRPITPYPTREPQDTANTAKLRELFGPTFRPLRKMYARLGDNAVKPYVITIDELSAEQYSSSLSYARSAPDSDTGIVRTDVDDQIAGSLREWSLKLTAQQYVAGLTAIQSTISDLQKRLLIAQYHAPNRTVLATELAHMANVAGGHPIVNAQYGRLGRLFVDATGHQPDHRTDGSNRWWAVWSRGYRTRKGFLWQMLPAVAAALENLGWVSTDFVAGEAPAPPGTQQPSALDADWAYRRGTTVARPEGSHTRASPGTVEVELEHNRLQNLLFERLCGEYGTDAVVMEEGFADIKVHAPDGAIDLFEVKSDRSPRGAIRSAIGQLLEYNFVATSSGHEVRHLVIAAPSKLGPKDAVYLAHLRRVISVELRYLQIDSTVPVDSYNFASHEAG